MTKNNKAANAVLRAAVKNVDGRLGRALRDGLLGLGIVYLLNAVGVWAMSGEDLAAAVRLSGMDFGGDEAVVRRLVLGTLLEGAGRLASIFAATSFLARTTWGMGRAAYAAIREGNAHA